jgi:hypothetical protein
MTATDWAPDQLAYLASAPRAGVVGLAVRFQVSISVESRKSMKKPNPVKIIVAEDSVVYRIDGDFLILVRENQSQQNTELHREHGFDVAAVETDFLRGRSHWAQLGQRICRARGILIFSLGYSQRSGSY